MEDSNVCWSENYQLYKQYQWNRNHCTGWIWVHHCQSHLYFRTFNCKYNVNCSFCQQLSQEYDQCTSNISEWEVPNIQAWWSTPWNTILVVQGMLELGLHQAIINILQPGPLQAVSEVNILQLSHRWRMAHQTTFTLSANLKRYFAILCRYPSSAHIWSRWAGFGFTCRALKMHYGYVQCTKYLTSNHSRSCIEILWVVYHNYHHWSHSTQHCLLVLYIRHLVTLYLADSKLFDN